MSCTWLSGSKVGAGAWVAGGRYGGMGALRMCGSQCPLIPGSGKAPPTRVYATVPQLEDTGKVKSMRALFAFMSISLQKCSNMHESKRIIKNSPFNPYVPILQLQSIYLCPSYFTHPPSFAPADFKVNPRHYTNFIWEKNHFKFIYVYKHFNPWLQFYNHI